MYPGLQTGDLSDDNLKFARQIGVENVVTSNLDELIPAGQKSWTKDALLKMREQTEKHGVKVDVVALPLSSHYIGGYVGSHEGL